MKANIKYLKDENGNVISPVISPDIIITASGGGYRPKLVWTNINPDVEFIPTKIPLNTDEYDYLQIHYIRNISNVNRRFVTTLYRGTSTVLFFCDYMDNTTNVRVWNRVIQDMIGSVDTNDCMMMTQGSSPETNNSLLVPYQIYAFNY